MKIDSTSLGMDAFSSHKDMTIKTTSIGGITNWKSFLEEGNLSNSLTVESSPVSAGSEESDSPSVISGITNTWDSENSRESYYQGTTASSREKISLENDKSGLSMTVEKTVIEESSASVEFSTGGTVQTADGRIIDFTMELSASREETSCITNRMQALLDPLVLSFDDGLNTLSDSTFSFDLNNDGTKELVSSLSSGSGFLALDRNGDGIINDGSELFGPQTGDGFYDLGKYDSDGNMWIDENDPIFDELKVWIGAGTEDARLVSLKEAGVGALFLGSVDTDFEMKNSDGEVLGNISRAGLFLMEDGEPRSIQEIDLSMNATDSFSEVSGSEDGSDGSVQNSSVRDALRQAIEILKILLKNRSENTIDQGYFSLFSERQERLEEKFWSWQESLRDKDF